uniref:PHD-type domain-containing protein n=1 Tax=Magallana gigas TaxID=29159 RepID=A0A8W8MEI4_MAGGI
MVANHDRLKKCNDRDIPLWLARYREKFVSGSPCDVRSDEDSEAQGSTSQGKRAIEGPVKGDDCQPKPARRRGRPRKLGKTPEEPYRGGDRPPRPSQSSSDTTEKSPETSTDTELYCLCHRPDDGKLMVQCDQCDCWYHGLDYDEGEAPQAPPPPGAARRRGSRGPSSTCPFLGCLVRTRTMRNHVTVAHLHPVFRRSVPPEAGASLRYRVLMWMAHHLLGEGATPEDLARDVPTG